MNLDQCGRCGNLMPPIRPDDCIVDQDGNPRCLCGDCLHEFEVWLANPAGGRLTLAAINAVARGQSVAELFGPGSPLGNKYGGPAPAPAPAFDRQA